MNDDPFEETDIPLDHLLSLADGPRDLPSGAEDRLLDAILETAAVPRADDAGEGRLRTIDASSRSGTDTRPTPPRRRSRVVGAMAAMAAAVAAVVVLAVVLPDSRPPEVADDPVAAAVMRLDTAALCDRAGELVDDLFLGPAVARGAAGDDVALRELAAILEEFADRIASRRLSAPADDVLLRLTAVVPALRLQASQVSGREVEAASRTRVRVLALLQDDPPLLAALGC